MNPSESSSLPKKPSLYRLRKSRKILTWSYQWYKKNHKSASPNELKTLENDMEKLDQALLKKDRDEADLYARKIEAHGQIYFKKTLFEYSYEFIFALFFALVIAVIVRQMWFEPYEIPTGSMRPTFEEQDHVTVTKTAFSLNFPLETKHLYFDPSLVQRTSIVIFSGDKIPNLNSDSSFLWVFPYIKRYIKRCMGKPGDSLYFYGGKIYGVDSEGQLIQELLDSPWIEKIEHIPFLTFDGDVTSVPNQTIFQQMHLPIGRLSGVAKELVGEVFNGKNWVKDNPSALKTPHESIQTYSDIFGIKNYATARLLTREELEEFTSDDISGLGEGVLYLELRHTPNLTSPKPLFFKNKNGMGVVLNPFRTVIPLQEKHLKAILDNLYTARFVVKDGLAKRYNVEETSFNSAMNPKFPRVPDGTYEFYYGKAYQIGFTAIAYQLPSDHPLYSQKPSNIQKLFNLGIEMNTAFAPYSLNQLYFPSRYAYFRDGDLYLMGAPILKKDDPTLIAFNEREKKRENESTTNSPYIAFKDYGPPLKEGKPDVDFIRTFGLTIPEKHYLVLGDNHAMSSDSRVFGTIPEQNLQGAPSLILWPPGDRWGSPAQKPYPLFTIPRLIVWGAALFIGIIYAIIHRRNLRRPIFKKLN